MWMIPDIARANNIFTSYSMAKIITPSASSLPKESSIELLLENDKLSKFWGLYFVA